MSDPFFSDDDIASFAELAASALQDRCSYTPPATPGGAKDDMGQPLPPSSPTTTTGIPCLYFDLVDEVLRRPDGNALPTQQTGVVWLGLAYDGQIAPSGILTLTVIWGRTLPAPVAFSVDGAVGPGRAYVAVPLRRLTV